MEKEEKKCGKCPDGQVFRDGRCVMPEVSFTALVMSLNASALLHLGEISDPAGGGRRQDLEMAKHTIDTLALLQKKTVGNLDDEEQQLLQNVLYDLKLRFVQAAAAAKEKTSAT